MPRAPLKPFKYWPAPTPDLSLWNVARVKRALLAHEQGDFRDSAYLASAMDRNPRIASALNTRILAVLGLPFAVQPSEAHKQRSGPLAKRLEARWFGILPEPVLRRVLRRALTLGATICEQVYDTRGGDGWWPQTLRPVHPHHQRWDDVRGRWLVMTTEGEVVVEPGDPQWVVFQHSATEPWMDGVVRCLGMEDAIRAYAVRDWARRSEKHGLPIAIARVPEAASEADKERFFDDVSALGRESTVMAAQGATEQESFDLELAEVADSKGELFSALIDKVDSDVSIALLGQNLSTEVKGGSFAAAKAHERVRADYLEADAQLLSTTARDQIAAPWAEYNAGDRALAPWPTWNADLPEDAAQTATTHKTAGEAVEVWNRTLAGQGLVVDLKAYAEKIGVPVRALTEAEKAAKAAAQPRPAQPAPESQQEQPTP
jgi:phage gp29-like protein